MKTRYFVVFARYHDTPHELIDHLASHGELIGNIFVHPGHDATGLTGSAEVKGPDEPEEES